MSFSKIFFSACACFSFCLLPSLEGKDDLVDRSSIEVNLKEPTFSDGALTTDLGGVVSAEGIRIQAKSITYINKTEQGQKIVKIIADGDLLFEYEGQFFTGDRLEYDFIQHTGYLSNGRTAYGIWFVGGDRIKLEEDGSFTLENAFVTTSENQDNTWDIRAKNVTLSPNHVVSASNIHLNLAHIPVLWLPSFKSNLGFTSDSPIRYRLLWDKGVGPRATVRYRVFSIEDFNLFARLDYRLSKGLGAAIESEYYSKNERTVFVTRSYGAHDKVVYDEHGLKRYRLQGFLSHKSEDNKTNVHLTYDKFSDLKMISDFPSSDFEVTTQKRSRLLITHQEEIAFGSIDTSIRLNPFESLNQKLPLAKAGIRPFAIGNTGILSENFVSAGYLDYVYAHDLIHSHPTLHETHAARIETRNRLYRPFSIGPLHLTPYVGVLGLFYNNNPQKESVGQGVFNYGGDITAPFYKKYGTARHTIEPYATYLGISRPKAHLLNHYRFTIEDGLYQINSLRLGLKNILSFANRSFFSPNLSIDLYTYAFFQDKTFTKTFPKAYLSLAWHQPTYSCEGTTCWNRQESVLDFFNLLTKVTVSEDTALIAEFRHRSRFDWRKADHENFLVDMARSIPDLVSSPLSDGRNTFLGRLQIRLSPKWNCGFSSHYGWGRSNEPSYHSFKIDTATLLSSKWQLKFSYLHTTNDDRFAMQMQLVK
ncbi:MAG: hypothetical protein JSS09_00205 [Verrucomicrobia bacterium]|nr:hypothetical protein [Verrucomicrobiota bacterium]